MKSFKFSGVVAALTLLSANLYADDKVALDPKLVENAVKDGITISKSFRPYSDPLFKRDAHAKPHGCVRAFFDVKGDLEPELRQGVFKQPGKRYAAWIRFSNGDANIQADPLPDARGMAIKLLNVPGPKLLEESKEAQTQDFVMFNFPQFFNKGAEDYAQNFAIQAKGDKFGYFIGWNPFKWHLREFAIAGRLVMGSAQTPLGVTYFSVTPYAYGPEVIKYRTTPCQPVDAQPTTDDGPTYLRTQLRLGLDQSAACFNFQVQKRVADAGMPIDDARVLWPEHVSPYQTVAQITIPRQSLDYPQQNYTCENFSFTPWHAIAEHEPLGSLNQLRKAVYKGVSTFRHGQNQTSQLRVEPTNWCLAGPRGCDVKWWQDPDTCEAAKPFLGIDNCTTGYGQKKLLTPY